MKRILDFKAIVTVVVISFFAAMPAEAQNFCCCGAPSSPGCTENFLFPNDCNNWCVSILGTTNNGTAAGYPDPICTGSACAPMPVVLTIFKGKTNRDNHVKLEWITASEIDNDGFEVQRTNSRMIWEPLSFVAAEGNSDRTIDYSFVDENPYQGVNYYRLKQMDFSGNFIYTDVIVVNADSDAGVASIFPTVAKDVLMLVYNEEPNGNLEIGIFDMMGKQILQTREQKNHIDLTSLTAGQYVIVFKFNDKITTERFIKVQ